MGIFHYKIVLPVNASSYYPTIQGEYADSYPLTLYPNEQSGLTANFTIDEIDAIVVSNSDTKVNEERQRHYPSLLSSLVKRKMPIIRVPQTAGDRNRALPGARCSLRLRRQLQVGEPGHRPVRAHERR